MLVSDMHRMDGQSCDVHHILCDHTFLCSGEGGYHLSFRAVEFKGIAEKLVGDSRDVKIAHHAILFSNKTVQL